MLHIVQATNRQFRVSEVVAALAAYRRAAEATIVYYIILYYIILYYITLYYISIV